MDTTLVVFGSIALSAATVLCITLSIVAIRAVREVARMTATLEEVGRHVREIKDRSVPLIEHATTVMQKTDRALDRVDGALQNVTAGTDSFRGIASDVRDMEQHILNRLRPSVDDATMMISGIVRGVTAIVRSFMKR